MGTVSDWLREHQLRLQMAFDGAKERIQAAACLRKERNDQHVSAGSLTKGEVVYLRDNNIQGRAKIQDVWGPTKYQVVQTPSDGGAVYSIAPLDNPGRIKHVHWTQLRPAPVTAPLPCRLEPVEPARLTTSIEVEEPDGEWWLVPQLTGGQ